MTVGRCPRVSPEGLQQVGRFPLASLGMAHASLVLVLRLALGPCNTVLLPRVAFSPLAVTVFWRPSLAPQAVGGAPFLASEESVPTPASRALPSVLCLLLLLVFFPTGQIHRQQADSWLPSAENDQ